MNNELVSSHEEWKPIEETKGIYSVSTMGRVKNNRTGYVLSPVKWKKGYVKVNLKIDGNSNSRLIHRLVAETFIPNPENKPEVNHKNGIKNDNRVGNLEWVTGEENRKHAYETGLVRHKDDRYSGYLHCLWKRVHRDNMCAEWQDFLVFREWCYENNYSEGNYVCVYNSDKEYSPTNCYISKDIQRTAQKYDCFGKQLSLDEMAKKYDLCKTTIEYRIKNGMSVEDAIMKPVISKRTKQQKPKTKVEKKEYNLRFRINEHMFNYLLNEAEQLDMSISSYVRELIDKDIQEKAKIFSEKK